MAVETATYISDFDVTYPLAGDPRSAGDDHLKLIKSVLKNTFPNIAGAVTVTAAEINVLAALIVAGTKMLFMQASAPTGWTEDATFAGRSLYIKDGSHAGASIGGSDNPLSNNKVPDHRHYSSLITSAVDINHQHSTVNIYSDYTGSQRVDGGAAGAIPAPYDHGATSGWMSQNNVHSHTVEGYGYLLSQANPDGISLGAWVPKYATAIVCTKD